MATGGKTKCWSEEYVEYQCVLCETNEKVKNADKYCFDCLNYLCESCVSIHNTLIKTHKVLPLSDDTIKKIVTERCEKHPNEVIQYFCRQHNALLCNTCKVQDHKKCQVPQHIRESADELYADPELQAVPIQLKSALDNINKAIQTLDKHVAFIQKNGNGFLKDLEDFAKKLLLRIEELKENGKKDIKIKQEEILSVAKQHRQAFIITKDEITQCLDKITKSSDLKVNMFVLKKKGQTIAQKVDESENLIKGLHFNFTIDMTVFDFLKDFDSLVKEVNAKEVSSQSAVGVEVASYRCKSIKRTNVTIRKDKRNCVIFGCCPLSDGSLVIADNNNRRLKRVDPSTGTVTKYCYTDGQPCDLCCIGPQEFAVAFGSTKVQVYCAVCLTRTRNIKLSHKSTNIACHGGLLYYAEWRGNILYVHDLISGKKLREIAKDTYGLDLFFHIGDIAVNGPGDRIYVADRGLVCVNTDGQQIFHLSPKDLGLSGASGVTTDHRGHVFVRGEGSYNVVKVTEDGHVVGKILSEEDGIEWPRCLSYDVIKSSPWCLSNDVSRCILYVGGWNGQLLMVEVK